MNETFPFAFSKEDEQWRRVLRMPPDKGSNPAISAGPRPKRTSNPKRVLIVEDDLDSARSMFMLLEDMGHAVEYAINGYVALDMARAFRPDVVFLDLGLPGPSGYDVCQRIKADPALKDVRVIVITGYGSDELRIRSQKLGCEVHLVKPVPVTVIEHLLG